MNVQNAASGHLASLRVTEGVFPNDLSTGSPAHTVPCKQRLTNVLIALCLISGGRASTASRVSRGHGVVGT